MKSLLSKKGYEIEKKSITKDQLNELKTELTVKPYIPDDDNVKSFEVFSETKTKIIIPRFYGTKKFGLAKKDTLKGNDANFTFNGQLRENQVKIVNKAIPYLKEYKGGILSVGCGAGKCLARGTKILMYSGYIKKVEDIQVGDLLMGDDSTPRKVLSLSRGEEEMFDIIPSRGEKYTVNRSHVLSLKYGSIQSKLINGTVYNKGNIIDISVDDYIKLQIKYNNNSQLKGFRVPVEFSQKQVILNPYIIGYWLGYDIETNNNVYNELAKILPDNSDVYILDQALNYYNLINDKHVPYDYKCNSTEIRLAVLAGLIDSHSSLNDNNGFDLCLKSEELIDDVIYLCRSLGFACYKKKICTYDPEKTYYIVDINGEYLDKIPLLLEKKKPKEGCQIKDPLNYDILVKSIGMGDYYGFEIDGNRRFVLGDFTVTHNTVMAIYLAAYLKAKTMVLVHKTFLLEQWMARIKQYTNAKVGILRQNIIPDHDCDIVVGMIQSISLKDYDASIFEGFKMLVCDECFPYRQNILTDNGPVEIGKLHELWDNGKQLPLIKSFNEKTKKFEYKKMTYAWEKKATELIRLYIGKKKIVCTPNHKFLTNLGYIEANKLTYKHLIYGIYNNNLEENDITRCLNDDQMQIVFGSFLGGGNIYCNNNKFILRVTHDINQREYCEWKANMFNSETKIIENNGFFSKKAIGFTTKSFDILQQLPKTRLSCPQWIIDAIDYRAIAIWYMDNGIINKKADNVTLSTCSFDEDSQIRLVNKLNSMGIFCKYFKSEYNYIKINEIGTKKIISEIYKYVYPSMKYKLGIVSFKKYVDKLGPNNYSINLFDKYLWNNKFLEYGFVRLTKIETCAITQKYKYVYDIEVEDNHNFIVCGINSTGTIVHNCHHFASPVFSKGLQKCGAPYILGLSATPFRPDKLTNVLYWNIGNIFYRQKTKSNKQVICKIMRYKTKDKLFAEKKQWRNGKMSPSHTKMINSFVEIKGRNQWLINILNELRKYPERKVLVLSGRKEHLKVLKESVDQSIGNDIESGLLEPLEYRTYYFMGGMKPRHRKEAEDNGDMLFGTFDMAHEGLDIDRLNTIVLATSKKNIVQSIGRVMRKILKIGDLRPLIIDFRDEISIYKNQGDKRLKQYKKGNYLIENYYIQDNSLLTLDVFLKNEYGMTIKEIKEYKKEHPNEIYEPELQKILDLQKVQEEDEKNNATAEIIELDPNDEDIDKESDDELDNLDDDSDSDDSGKFKKANYGNYLF